MASSAYIPVYPPIPSDKDAPVFDDENTCIWDDVDYISNPVKLSRLKPVKEKGILQASNRCYPMELEKINQQKTYEKINVTKEMLEVNRNVTFANIFAESYIKLNTFQQKFLMLIISMINRNDSEFKEYTFKIRDIVQKFEMDNRIEYKRIKQAYEDLRQTFLYVRDDEARKEHAYPLVGKISYGRGQVSIILNNLIREYLLLLKAEFTSVRLDDVLRLSNVHFIRIFLYIYCKWHMRKEYAIRCGFKKNEEMHGKFDLAMDITVKEFMEYGFRVSINLSDLRYMLFGNDKEKYKQYNNFKRVILLPFIEELKNETYFDIWSIEEKRRGRAVDEIVLHIRYTDYGKQEIPRLISSSKRNAQKEIAFREAIGTWKDGEIVRELASQRFGIKPTVINNLYFRESENEKKADFRIKASLLYMTTVRAEIANNAGFLTDVLKKTSYASKYNKDDAEAQAQVDRDFLDLRKRIGLVESNGACNVVQLPNLKK